MWRLAWRNLFRNKVRTAITGSAITFSLMMQLVGYGIQNSTYEKMEDAAGRAAGGSVLLYARGFWLSQTSDLVVREVDGVMKTIGAVPEVKTVIPRIIVNGLVSSARGNAGIRLLGIDPVAEAELLDNSTYLEEGEFLKEAPKTKEGQRPSRTGMLVLPKSIVKDLKIQLGDRVVVTSTDPEGEVTRLAFRLTGITDTGSEMEGASTAWTSLGYLQRQLGLENAVTQLGVLIEDDLKRAQIKDRIVSALGDDAERLEAFTWSESMPEMLTFIELDKTMGEMFGLLIFLVVAFGIANTFLVAIMERIREFGVLSALGMTPGRVGSLVVHEAILLASLSISMAVGFAYGLHRWIASTGIDFTEMSGSEIEISGVIMDDLVIYSVVDVRRWAITCMVVFILIVLSAAYPAFKATRMEPATAMRTYE